VSNLLEITYEAHNAIADVTSLKNLVHSVVYPPLDVYNSMLFNREKNKNLPSLTCFVSSSVCKITTAEYIAGSGLNIRHLNTIYRRSREDGLEDIFTNKNSDGAPRVTKVNKRAQRALGRSPDKKVKGHSGAIYRAPLMLSTKYW